MLRQRQSLDALDPGFRRGETLQPGQIEQQIIRGVVGIGRRVAKLGGQRRVGRGTAGKEDAQHEAQAARAQIFRVHGRVAIRRSILDPRNHPVHELLLQYAHGLLVRKGTYAVEVLEPIDPSINLYLAGLDERRNGDAQRRE